MPRPSFKDSVQQQAPSTRIDTAKLLISRIVDHTLEVVALHETNAIVLYSPRISGQIPQSFAAHAFNATQVALHQMEVLRVTALWDKPDFDTASIPSVVELIDCPTVIEALAEETRAAHAATGVHHLNPDSNPEVESAVQEMIRQSQEAFASRQAEKARDRLTTTIDTCRSIVTSRELASIRNIRDKHIAHALERTRLEQRTTVSPMKYGDETKLLEETIPIVENLYCWVNGTSFDIENDSCRIARRRAEELWENCRFSIPTR